MSYVQVRPADATSMNYLKIGLNFPSARGLSAARSCAVRKPIRGYTWNQ